MGPRMMKAWVSGVQMNAFTTWLPTRKMPRSETSCQGAVLEAMTPSKSTSAHASRAKLISTYAAYAPPRGVGRQEEQRGDQEKSDEHEAGHTFPPGAVHRMTLGDVEHALQSRPGPLRRLAVDGDLVHDPALDEVLEAPRQVCGVD